MEKEKRYAPEIIADALREVQFENREEVEAAKQEIAENPEGIEIEGWRVIDWITEHADDWHPCEIFPGVKNIEEVFEATFELSFLVTKYFCNRDNWFNRSDEELFDEFKELTGHDVTADEVVENIDLDEIRESVRDDVGIMGYLQFLHDNDGDTSALVKRLVEVIDDLTPAEIDEIVVMTEYIDVDEDDAEKIYEHVDWSRVRANDQIEEYLEFFSIFAPSLNVAI